MTDATSTTHKINYADNAVIKDRAQNYATLTVDSAKILESWRDSLFSHEWLTPDGNVRPPEKLNEKDRERRQDVEAAISTGAPLEKPVLGIGMMDNVEIGAGKAVFLTLAANGVSIIPVHVPKAHAEDFKAFEC